MNGHPLSSLFIDYLLLCTYWRTTAQSTLGRGAMTLYSSSLECEIVININPAVVNSGYQFFWAVGYVISPLAGYYITRYVSVRAEQLVIPLHLLRPEQYTETKH